MRARSPFQEECRVDLRSFQRGGGSESKGFLMYVALARSLLCLLSKLWRDQQQQHQRVAHKPTQAERDVCRGHRQCHRQ